MSKIFQRQNLIVFSLLSSRQQDNHIPVQYPSTPTTYHHNYIISLIIAVFFKINKTSKSVLHAHQNPLLLKCPMILLKDCINSLLNLQENILQMKLAQRWSFLTLHGMQNKSGLSMQLSRISFLLHMSIFLPTLLVNHDHLKHYYYYCPGNIVLIQVTMGYLLWVAVAHLPRLFV